MAIGAGGRIAFAFDHRFAVDAGGQVFGFLVVALAAGGRLPRKMQGRERRAGWKDRVGIVTVLARGSIGAASLEGQSVNAGAIAFALAFVAGPAIDGSGRDSVVRMFGGKVGVATGAGIGLVSGSGKFCGIHEQGEFLSGGVGPGEGFVGVAIEAETVSDFLGGPEGFRGESIRGEWGDASQAEPSNCRQEDEMFANARHVS